MTATTLAVIMGVCAIPILAGMWFGWRARLRRDRSVLTSHEAQTGAVLATVPRIGYVSTTPVGSPFERVAVPGLAYRGYAEVTVRTDGVTIAIPGEPPVSIPAADVIGSATARTRVGKAVERDGLALIVWRSGDRELESSFRALTSADQHELTAAIDRIAPPNDHTTQHHHTTQEDA